MNDQLFFKNLQSVFNDFHSGIIVLDRKLKIICWNDWMAELSQFKAEEIIDQSFESLFPELVNQRIHQAIISNIKSGFPATISNILNKSPFPLYIQGNKNNPRIQQQLYITRLSGKYSEGNVYCLVNIIDVTAARLREKALENQVREREKAEQKVLKKTNQLQSALSVSNAGLFFFHTENKQLFLDAKAAQIFDLDVNTTKNMLTAVCNLVHPKDSQWLCEFFNNANSYDIDSPVDFEFRILTPANKVQWIELKGILSIEAESINKSIQGVLVDITRKKANQDLLREKKAAEIANHAKSIFLANMSHELRTPLHSILSFASLGLSRTEEASKEKTNLYFSRIHQSGELLHNLLNDLLDLSKLEAGKIELKHARHDLHVLVKQVLNEHTKEIKALEIQIECDYQPGETIAEFDNIRIFQVISNLLSNAIKASPKGGKIIFSIQKDDNGIELKIKDQGSGVPETELNSIFEKFQQSSQTNNGSGGTGLGLAICKEIITGHNGSLGVTNNPDGGACFYFRIPVIQENTSTENEYLEK